MISRQLLQQGVEWGPLTWRALLHDIGLGGPGDAIPLFAGPYLWTAALLDRVKSLRPEQRQLLLQELREKLLAVGRQRETDDYQGPFMLVFSDGRYVTWTGARSFLDLETGDPCPSLPQPVLESLGYNLTELFRREQLRCCPE